MVLQLSLEYVVTKLYLSHRWCFVVQTVGARFEIILPKGSIIVVRKLDLGG